MKKFFAFYLFATVLVLFFSSCHKMGVYNPSKKIEKIYSESVFNDGEKLDTIQKYLKEKWVWAGNLLTTVYTYDMDGKWCGTTLYTYDKKNRVIYVESRSASLNTVIAYHYFYDYDKLLKIDVMTEGDNFLTYEIESDWLNRITKINEVIKWNSRRQMPENTFAQAFRFILPENVMANLAPVASCVNRSMKTATNSYELTSKNGNVERIRVFCDGELTSDYSYEFDSKMNPFRWNLSDDYLYVGLNKNNIVSVVEKNEDGRVVYSASKIIDYDDYYPVKIVSRKNYTESDEIAQSEKEITHLQYIY